MNSHFLCDRVQVPLGQEHLGLRSPGPGSGALGLAGAAGAGPGAAEGAAETLAESPTRAAGGSS